LSQKAIPSGSPFSKNERDPQQTIIDILSFSFKIPA